MIVKMIDNGHISSTGLLSGNLTTQNVVEIDENEYKILIEIFINKPPTPEGYVYKLRADTLEWELHDLPKPEPIEEEATAEDYEAALAELGVK